MSDVDDLVDEALLSSGAESGPSDTTPSEASGDSSVTAGTGLGDNVPVPSASGKKRKPKVYPPSRSLGQCPRWMHHRKGVFCKACERIP